MEITHRIFLELWLEMRLSATVATRKQNKHQTTGKLLILQNQRRPDSFNRMLRPCWLVFFYANGIVHKGFVLPGQTVNQKFYLEVLKRLCNSVRNKKTRNLEQWQLVLSPRQCPCPHGLQCAAAFGKKTTRQLSVIFGSPLEHPFPPIAFAFSSHFIQVTLSRTHPAHNHQQSHSFVISLVLLHVRNITSSVSFWNISKFWVPVVEDKASLPSSQNPRPDLIMICTNPVHIFTTNIFMFSVNNNSLFCECVLSGN